MEQQTVNLVDLGVAGVVLVSAVFAFYRGFVRETLAIAGWVGAALVAIWLFDDARPYVARYIEDDLLVNAVTGAGLFLIALVAFWLVIHLIVMRVKSSPLNALDRSLGFLFGVARGIVVVALAYMVAVTAIWADDEHPPPTWLKEARSLPLIDYAAGLIESALPPDILHLPDAGFQEMQKTRGEVERLSRPPLAGDGEGDDAGYRDADSQAMDRLIDSLQDAPAPAAGPAEEQR
jgi:membrane protein required for colicin V production